MRRPRKRNWVLVFALFVSGLIHLSAVTLFQIVIFFPRAQADYFNMKIVEARVSYAAVMDNQQQLHVPNPEDALERQWAQLPKVDLPTIEFSELERLRVRVKSQEIREQYESIFAKGPEDIWARFGRKLNALSSAIIRVAGGPLSESVHTGMHLGHPAPGFDAYVEWMSEPMNREAVSVSKIKALWGHDPAELEEPIVLVFKVNEMGKVIEIIPPFDDDNDIIEGSVSALFKYRFEALSDGMGASQHGTFIIRATGGSP